MRALSFTLAMLVLITSPMSRSNAGVDPGAEIPPAGSAELVVMEAEGCTYCTIFRRDVLPSYEMSEHAKSMPVRFVDINDVEKSGIVLDGPISMVPTFVVIKNHREIGRIPGYLGRENFFHAISYLLSTSY